MSATCGVIDARLADFRSVRQRCAGALRAALRDAAPLTAAGAPQDRQEALELERRAAAAALELLLTPALPLAPALTKAEREIEAVVALSMRPEEEWPRPRNRSHRLPEAQGVPVLVEELVHTSVEQVEEPLPAPEPEPEPPQLTGWRLARARRLQAAGVGA